MTIDELFNMPIFQMKKWLSDNYKDPIGSYKNDYWFTNINECFGVKFPKGGKVIFSDIQGAVQ